LDTSTIRTDLIIDCIRTSDSPQVQNTAILLVAGLAAIAPELVLHSIMPIFTFMGSSVLKKDDEYSALVIDQVILKSLSRQDQANYLLVDDRPGRPTSDSVAAEPEKGCSFRHV
jgi:hypothetical protein